MQYIGNFLYRYLSMFLWQQESVPTSYQQGESRQLSFCSIIFQTEMAW